MKLTDTPVAQKEPVQEQIPAEKLAYAIPASSPTQNSDPNIQFDFNEGCRIAIVPNGKPWHIRIIDSDTKNVIFENDLEGGMIQSTKRYYVPLQIEAFQEGKLKFIHTFSAKDRNVLIQLAAGTLGDSLGWLPYAVKFKEKHQCKLTIAIGAPLIPLVKSQYPDIEFITKMEIKPEKYYATYYIGLFFDDKDLLYQPYDFRYVGLHRTAGYILGVNPDEVPPKVTADPGGPPISRKYVCIATQSTTQAKYWNNPLGWRQIIHYLTAAGYEVVCIDQAAIRGAGLIWNLIPHGVRDETGDRPLSERARWLKHCEFFIGLSSGLAWLAWAMNKPIVLISGFTHPTNEFFTPYRVINTHACNSCWNDPAHKFAHDDAMWCPRHVGTPRQFECTRLITGEQVMAAINRIPGFTPPPPSWQPRETTIAIADVKR